MAEKTKKLPFKEQVLSMPANFWVANSMELLERLAFFGVRAEDHASSGSDWDGAIMPPRDMPTCLELPRLVQIMLDRGRRLQASIAFKASTRTIRGADGSWVRLFWDDGCRRSWDRRHASAIVRLKSTKVGVHRLCGVELPPGGSSVGDSPTMWGRTSAWRKFSRG